MILRGTLPRVLGVTNQSGDACSTVAAAVVVAAVAVAVAAAETLVAAEITAFVIYMIVVAAAALCFPVVFLCIALLLAVSMCRLGGELAEEEEEKKGRGGAAPCRYHLYCALLTLAHSAYAAYIARAVRSVRLFYDVWKRGPAKSRVTGAKLLDYTTVWFTVLLLFVGKGGK